MWLPQWLDKKKNHQKTPNKQKTNKTFTSAKISPKIVNPRDKAGNVEEEEEEDMMGMHLHLRGYRVLFSSFFFPEQINSCHSVLLW